MIRMLRKGKKRQSPVFSTLKELDMKSVQTAKETEPASLETNTVPDDASITEFSPSRVAKISEQKVDDSSGSITNERMREEPGFISPLEELDPKNVKTMEETEPISLEANTVPDDASVTESSPSRIAKIPEQEVDDSSGSITNEQMREEAVFEEVRTADLISIFENAFILIHPGTFLMGSAEYEMGRDKGEVLHEVTLTKRFYMQTTPVTQVQWKSVMGSNPSKFTKGGDECPVENVTWHDCLDFIKILNSMGTAVFRLPTEAEWEYTCRAGSSESCSKGMIMEFFCGHDSCLDAVGWYCGNSNRKTHPVTSKNANEWGLYDMHGNVFEWCQDWYGPYSSEKRTDPIVSLPGPGRVIRGGSWFANAKNCRSAARLYWSPQSKSDFIGFRLVKEAS